ncbi:MAG: hypothetical protein ACFBRM_02655 [Pikeienuella sp.]
MEPTGSLGLMCLIATNTAAPVDLFAVRRAAQAVAPGVGLTIERRKAPPAETGLMIWVDGEQIALHAGPGRIPEREYGDAVIGNLLWPEAGDAMARHRGTVTLCAVRAAADRAELIAQAAALTRLAAILAEATQACGAHWIGTQAMVSPQRLKDAATELAGHRMPADLWIGFRFVELPGAGALGPAVRTHNARPYLGHEIELPPMPSPDRIGPIRLLYAAVQMLLGQAEEPYHGQLGRIPGEQAVRFQLAIGAGTPAGVARIEILED